MPRTATERNEPPDPADGGPGMSAGTADPVAAAAPATLPAVGGRLTTDRFAGLLPLAPVVCFALVFRSPRGDWWQNR